jgi:DNA-binding FrmR family transcriptional regulator
MSHTIKDKTKLLHRVNRIQGQIGAVEKMLQRDEDCSLILRTIASCGGALNGLLAEILEEHIRQHILDPKHKPTADQIGSIEELIDVVKAYIK